MANKDYLRNSSKGKTEDQDLAWRYFYEPEKISKCIGKKANPKYVSDAEFDNMLVRVLEKLNHKQRALAKTGVEEEAVSEVKPVCFMGYNDKGLMRLGDDDQWRGSKYEVTWLFFGSEEIYLHRIIFSLIDDEKKEETEEYFYKDVTSMSTVNDSKSITVSYWGDDPNGAKEGGCMGIGRKPKQVVLEDKEEVEFDEFVISVMGDKFRCSMEGMHEDAEEIIKGVKTLLRSKKFQ